MELGWASSGMPALDRVLEGLRLGDNVVWQVDSIEDYAHFVRPFAENAMAEGQRLVYMRFGAHQPLLSPGPGLRIYQLEAERGFEHFSTAVREIVTAEGEGAYYVFDCLSDLLPQWSTDLMIGNFFLVTCPYLFALNTIAYFSLLRGRHSHGTIARIRDTTQLLLDVYHQDRYYLHPLKVWKRYSPTMFLPHAERESGLVPLTSSAEAAQVFASYRFSGLGETDRRLDYWDHLFLHAAELARSVREGEEVFRPELESIRDKLNRLVIGRDEQVLALAGRYLSLDDLLAIKARLIGSGYIGGKAAGLILARAILAKDQGRSWTEILEPHDSFYIGSDVYYTFLVENGCWQLRQEQRREENYFALAPTLRAKIRQGTFPEAIRGQFLEMLEYFGQAPIIVRSSSLLEDGFGNAFAGKYDSVFCTNQGDLSHRYEQFINAVRQVYASTMNEEALAYRFQRGLAQSDEQMALLVQRVSGAQHGQYFFPDLGGVALSHNLYVWRPDMDPTAGMLRLVAGLGTRAVDRTGDDYARFVALDQPLRRPEANAEERATYTQHDADVLDLERGDLSPVSLQKVIPSLQARFPFAHAERDQRSEDGPARWALDLDPVLGETAFPLLMREMLRTLAAAYSYPVDTEFTVNFGADRRFSINLLQCRPLQVRVNQRRIRVPKSVPPERILFSAGRGFMGNSLELQIARIVYVVPQIYAGLSGQEKHQVARLIGKLNRSIPRAEETPAILCGPGRWGTSTPSLGVPVTFAEIDRFLVLGEIAFVTSGFVPELSYGTHFFQDLVETGVAYFVLDERQDSRFNHDLFAAHENALATMLPEAEAWQEAIKVLDLGKEEVWLYADAASQRVLCWKR